MPYVNQRWLGGLLTNFQTISKRIKRLHELRDWTESGSMDLLPARERIGAMAERDKLETNLGGVADMQRPPDAMFVVDLKTEAIGVREAARLKIPVIGLVDTELRPRPGRLRDPRQRRRDPLLPGRDQAIADVVGERPSASAPRRRRARREREEQERREAEERAQREAGGAGAPRRPRSGPARGGGGRLLARRAATPSGTRPEAASGAGAPRERRTFDPDDDS